MDVRVIHHAARGENRAALFRVDDVAFGATWIVYCRVFFERHRRVDEWTRCTPEQTEAHELYQRAVEDFVQPVPFALARVEPEEPPRNPTLFQVVQGDARSVPMALNAAEREAEIINNGGRQ